MINLRKLGSPKDLEFQKSVLGNDDISKEDVEKMRNILMSTGTYDRVIKLGWDYVEEGKKYIPFITGNPALRDIFESLLVYMMERTK